MMLGADETMALLAQWGLALESAKGPLPRLTEAIFGEPIQGSWWKHAESRHIWAVLGAVRGSDDVLVFRLARGKLTYAHRSVWPALVALADEIGHERLTAVADVHTRAGHHETIETAYPGWVPADVTEAARSLPLAEARRRVGAVLQ